MVYSCSWPAYEEMNGVHVSFIENTTFGIQIY